MDNPIYTLNYDEIQLSFAFRDTPPALLTVDEIYAAASQSLFEKLHEDRRIERKPAGIHARQLGEYFCMWANTPTEGGIIAVGVENDGSMSGCSEKAQSHINDLEKAGQIFCPEARYESKPVRVVLKDGREDYILLIRVFYKAEGKVAKTTNGDAFIRIGDSKFQLKDEQIREIEIDRGAVDFEREPSRMEYPAAFDLDLIDKYVANFSNRRKLSGELNREEILELSHLGKIETNGFAPNNACTLMFAKDPRDLFPGCRVRFLRFDGEHETTGEKWNAVKDLWIDAGSVPRLIVAVEKVLEAQIREFSSLGSDGIFYTAPEYPKEAWYEVVVNACVHRSYSQRNMSIFIKMFDNRLVIESPGGFPPLVTSENIYDMHQPRNPRLMDAMFYFDFVKCAHEGTRRIRDSMIGMRLPMPRFEQKQINAGLVQVTLQNDIKHRKVWVDKDATEIVGSVLAELLTDHERRIINFIAEHGKISVSQAQRLTGKSWPSANKILKGLKQKGILDDIRRAVKDRDTGARYVLKGTGVKKANARK